MTVQCPHCSHSHAFTISRRIHCDGCGVWFPTADAGGIPPVAVAFQANPMVADYDTAALVKGYAEAGYSIRWERPIILGVRSAGRMTKHINAATPVIGAGVGSGLSGVFGILQALGVDLAQWDLPAYPSELRQWLGRKVSTVPMSEILDRLSRPSSPLFVKSNRDKDWASCVLRGPGDVIGYLHVPEDYPMLVSDVVDFVAEWRVFVCDGEVIDVAGYKGDPLAASPPRRQVLTMAAAIDRRAWSFDVGLTSDGRYLLVEAHTALCLGQYGLGPHLGFRLHSTAWAEAMTYRRRSTTQPSSNP